MCTQPVVQAYPSSTRQTRAAACCPTSILTSTTALPHTDPAAPTSPPPPHSILLDFPADLVISRYYPSQYGAGAGDKARALAKQVGRREGGGRAGRLDALAQQQQQEEAGQHLTQGHAPLTSVGT